MFVHANIPVLFCSLLNSATNAVAAATIFGVTALAAAVPVAIGVPAAPVEVATGVVVGTDGELLPEHAITTAADPADPISVSTCRREND